MIELPDEHYTRVGRVAVAAAQLEEAGAMIVHASEGNWDMTPDHLRFAGSKPGLIRQLKETAECLPPDLVTRHFPRRDGQPGLEDRTGVVRSELVEWIQSTEELLDRRDRIVHSVPWEDVFRGTGVEAIHPRSFASGNPGARQQLPTEAEVQAIVGEIGDAIRLGVSLAGRVGSTLNPEGPK